MRADAAKPCSAHSSLAWLRDGPVTTPEPNKSLVYLLLPISPTAMLLLGFPLGFCTAGIPASMATLFSELYPEEIRGSGVGFCYNAGRIFAAGLPALIGWSSGSMSLGTAIGIDASASYFLVLVAVLLLPETRGSTFEHNVRFSSPTPDGAVRDAII